MDEWMAGWMDWMGGGWMGWGGGGWMGGWEMSRSKTGSELIRHIAKETWKM